MLTYPLLKYPTLLIIPFIVNIPSMNIPSINILSFTKYMYCTETSSIAGNLPSEVHFDVNMYYDEDIASLNEEDLGVWLKKRWEEKESKLGEFYQNQSFGSSHVFEDTWMIMAKKLGYLLLGVFHLGLFLYYLPWTLLFATATGLITFGVIRSKNGWSTVTLERVGEI